MKNLFGCLGLLIAIPLLVIGLILFHAWYFECIYNIGLTPLFTLFDIVLPAIEYKYFVFITVIIGSIGLYFKDTNKQESEENKVKVAYNM